MKILIYTPSFLPKIGGLENMAAMLAQEFYLLDKEIRLITYTDEEKDNNSRFTYEVFRNPSAWQLLKLVKWCDVFFQLNVSLKGLWPLLLYKRPYVVSHQTSNVATNGYVTLAGKLKQLITKYALNICCSSYIAKLLPSSSIVIPNCYNASTFINLYKNRPYELIFVGRLVSDKGCNLIIQALIKLKSEGIYPSLTIIGFGPEEIFLSELTNKHNLQSQIKFVGAKKGKELVEILNEHQIMIVPSIWEEPFGIVALEGLACGCQMIVADVGGLPEAIGTHGTLFEKQNINDLAEKIKIVLHSYILQENGLLNDFLVQHSPKQVAKSYLSAIQQRFHFI